MTCYHNEEYISKKEIAEAARKNKLNKANIISVCNGKRKHCGGFKWKYKIKECDVNE